MTCASTHDRFFLPADDMLGFVHIPADTKFRIGTRKVDAKRVAEIIAQIVLDNELNDESTATPEFYIARYPVTVAQFRVFVEDTQFDVGNPGALRDPDTRPVRCVNWHHALAYCEWLTHQFAVSTQLKSSPIANLVRKHDWRVTLPNELEWEKAARGATTDAVFTWGDTPDPNRANYRETGILVTSAVGCFPDNGIGLFDMLGNVWEWTRSHHKSYPYCADDGREDVDAGNDVLRVMRGGSFSFFRGGARCAYRYGFPPNASSDDSAFRVVLSRLVQE